MSDDNSATCLVLTHLDLHDVGLRRVGVFKRQAMLCRAIGSLNYRITVVCPEPGGEPGDSKGSARKRLAEQLSAYWRVDVRVRFVPRAKAKAWPWVLQQIAGVLSYRWSAAMRFFDKKSFRKLVASLLSESPGLVLAHRLPSMTLLRPQLARSSVSGAPPVLFDLDDIEHVTRFRSTKALESIRDRVFAMLSVPALYLAERASTRASFRTLVCSDSDAQYAGRAYSSKAVAVVPNAVPIPRDPVSLSNEPIILMVGVYHYEPNADGADYFVSDVLPLVLKEEPRAKLWLAGAGYRRLKSYSRQAEGVEFLGFVDDLRAVYERAKIAACPIRYGSGTRIKLVEAAALGMPIVSTSTGAEGLDFQHREHALLADSSADFARACVQLLRSNSLCCSLGSAARRLAEEKYDARNTAARIENLLTGILR